MLGQGLLAGLLSAGGRNVDKFTFEEGVTPLTSPPFHFGIIALYLLSVWFNLKFMDARRAANGAKGNFGLKYPFFFHNVLLCGISFILFADLGSEILSHWLQHDLFWTVCSFDTIKIQALHLLYYANHLTKLYELLDTHFVIFRGRRPDFLQVYHHAATLFLTWIQMVHWSSVQWVPILANLLVHIVMYAYYALTTLGYRPWWKQWVTNLQIIQFLLDIVFIFYCSWRLITHGDCQGDLYAVYSGCFILTSYLLLFLRLYVKLYGSKAKAPTKKGQ